MEPAAPIVVMAPRVGPHRKTIWRRWSQRHQAFPGGGQAAWQAQGCRSDQERRGILWAHLGEEVRQEMNACWMATPRTHRGWFKPLKRVMVNGGAFPRCWVCSRAPNKNKGETTLAFSHRLRGIFDSVRSRQRETEVVVSRPVSFCVTTLQRIFMTPSSVASSRIVLRWTQR